MSREPEDDVAEDLLPEDVPVYVEDDPFDLLGEARETLAQIAKIVELDVWPEALDYHRRLVERVRERCGPSTNAVFAKTGTNATFTNHGWFHSLKVGDLAVVVSVDGVFKVFEVKRVFGEVRVGPYRWRSPGRPAGFETETWAPTLKPATPENLELAREHGKVFAREHGKVRRG